MPSKSRFLARTNLVTHTQQAFNVGAVGWALKGRTDLKEYMRAVEYGRNVIFWPQGPFSRRPGFAYVREFTPFVDEDLFLCRKFSINKRNEYIFVFSTDGLIYIVNNQGQLVATLSHGYSGAHLRSLRFVQAGKTLILTNSSGMYPPRQIRNNGSQTNWAIADINITTPAYHGYRALTLTPGATSGATVTMTLSGSDGYWNRGHPASTRIKVNAGAATIQNLQQNATGGTALSSAGTAANIFDSNSGTTCNCGSNGWAGYTFGGTTSVRVVGINANSTVTADLIFEAADNAAFTTNLVNVGSVSGVVLTAGTTIWVDVPNYTAKLNFRVRVTNGVVLDIRDATFNRGLVAIANITTTLSGTTAATFREEFIGPHVGYPRTCTFKDDRLVFGGIGGRRGQLDIGDPSLVFARKTGDYFNFDDTAATEAFSWRGFVQGEGNDEILNLAPSRSGLAVFTSEAEFILEAQGSTGITPASPPKITRQTRDGCADIPTDGVDGGLIFVSRDFKQIKVFDYEFAIDSYRSDPLTLYAHDIFSITNLPRRLCILKNFDKTQGTMICAPSTNGTLLVCQFSADRTPAWAEWDMPNGRFLDCEVIEYCPDPNDPTATRPTLFALVAMDNGGGEKLVLLRMDDYQGIHLDAFFYADYGSPQTVISGSPNFTRLYANSDVKTILDGTVDALYPVDGAGTFTLNYPATDVVAGVMYESYVKSLPIPIENADARYKGNQITWVRIVVDHVDTSDLWVNDDHVLFRELGDYLLDQPLVGKTDTIDVPVNAPADAPSNRVAYWEMWVDEPVPMTITSVTSKVLCSK